MQTKIDRFLNEINPEKSKHSNSSRHSQASRGVSPAPAKMNDEREIGKEDDDDTIHINEADHSQADSP